MQHVLIILSLLCFSGLSLAERIDTGDAASLTRALKNSPYTSRHDRCSDLTTTETRRHIQIVQSMGRRPYDPRDYPATQAGFSRFLNDIGIEFFSAREVIIANNVSAAVRCGFSGGKLLAPRCRWLSAAALLAATDRMRIDINSTISVRNWWRPSCYNSAVGGAGSSDHIHARALDLDFTNSRERYQAVQFACDEFWNRGKHVQMGVGAQTLHLGFSSPRGKRCWYYRSLGTGSTSCSNPCR